ISADEFNALFSRLDAGTASSMMQFQQSNPLEKLFSTADEDGDGSLTLEELTAAAPEGMSDDEAAEVAARMFGEMDTDGDGSLTQSEMQAFEGARRPEGGRMPPPPMTSGTEEESGTSTLADILASALDEEDETSEDSVVSQLQAYLKQMRSGSEEETSLAERIFA
ncbi:MAG: EF-hand domain-containing protein, partial [Parvibaculum sp.]|nr:EF-hand domain-containing protein [Parvibaculum sp.]